MVRCSEYSKARLANSVVHKGEYICSNGVVLERAGKDRFLKRCAWAHVYVQCIVLVYRVGRGRWQKLCDILKWNEIE